jgi:hypothetical protein
MPIDSSSPKIHDLLGRLAGTNAAPSRSGVYGAHRMLFLPWRKIRTDLVCESKHLSCTTVGKGVGMLRVGGQGDRGKW